MENSNSEKLIERIEEAKGWLDKAKDEYSKANPVRGGLILSLAQAEVKHAWELSHDRFVSKSVPEANCKPKIRYFIPVAASIVLFTGLVVGMRVGGIWFPTSHKLTFDSVAKTKIGQSKNPINAGVVKTQPNVVSVIAKKPETTVLASQPSDRSLPKSQIVNEQTADSSRTTSSLRGNNGPEVAQNQPTLKPVSQLSIDEEALTKEASHSLRNGK
jgi:hypothetical protein